MILREKIAQARIRPKAYVENTLPSLTFTLEDNFDELICMMVSTSFQNMPETFYKLVQLVESIPNFNERTEYQYYYHLSLASFYKYAKNSDLAIDHCMSSNEFAYKMNYVCGIVQTYRFLSTVYLSIQDHDNAMYYCKLAIKESNHCSDHMLIANTYNLYGAVLHGLELYSEAINAYKSAIDVVKHKDNYKEDMMYYLILMNIGEAYMEMDNFASAEPYFTEAIDLSERYGHEYNFGSILQVLIDFYKKKGDFEKAVKYYEKVHALKENTSQIQIKKDDKDDLVREKLSQLDQLRKTNDFLLKRLHEVEQANAKNDDHLKLELQDQLKTALEDKRIHTYYQSKYSLKSNKVVGAEALIRWQDGEIIVKPGVFIPKIEDTGLIIPLSNQVIADSIKLCKYIVSHFDENFKISINIAPYQLEHQELSRFIQSELLLNGLSADHLELEITERSFFNQSSNSINQMMKLQDLGIGISLDDFGTGYSSLSNISEHHFDCIKLDRSLLTNITKDKKAYGLLCGIIGMFKALKIDTVIEGVEAREVEELLRSLECDHVQGFYYDKPMNEDLFIDKIRKQHES